MQWQSSQLRQFYSAFLISELGNFSARVTLAVIIYDLTGSSVSLAASFLVTKLPTLLLGNPIGAFVQRMNAKHVMVVSDCCALVLFIGLAFWYHILGPIGTMCGFFCAYVLIAVFDAAKSHCVAVLCPEHKAMNRAVATLAEIIYLTIAVGPFLSGYLIKWFDISAALLFNSATYACSILLIAPLRIPLGVSRFHDAIRGFFRWRSGFGLFENLAIIRRCDVLTQFSALYLLRSITYGLFNAIVPVLALRHLHIGSAGLGQYFLFSCLGGLVGARIYKVWVKLNVPTAGPLQVCYVALMSLIEAIALALCTAATTSWGFYLAGFLSSIPMLLVETRIDFLFLYKAPSGQQSSLRAFQQFIKAAGFTIGIFFAIALAPHVTSRFVPLLMFCGLILPLLAFAVNPWSLQKTYDTLLAHK